MAGQVKYLLDESELPSQWYNVIPDLPSPPPPPLHPGTREPVGPADLAPLFPAELIAQEVSPERYIAIPEEVRDIYRLWRPTPLIRARRLERDLGTPARIYYKYEGTSPAGSHKPNTAVPQAYYNAQEGVRRLTTETGAGQWGSALAFACAVFGLQCEVWQVRASYDQKPYRKLLMETYGATVHPSPSDVTAAGRAILAEHPDSTGSLGIAISEAVEVAAGDPGTRYSLGSVLNHVLMHQTVIGQEALKQFALAGETGPDLIIGCTGGGSNFAGLALPFLGEKLAGRMSPVLRAVEPAACPSFTRGVYAYDFGDTAGMTPLLKMHTLGHEFVPDPIHAGGLRYHGMSPLLSHIYELGLMEAVAKPQSECFEAGLRFARTEGIVPAPEPTHAIAAAIEEALRCKETGEEKVILTAVCGHGLLDLSAYGNYQAGQVQDFDLPAEAVQAALAGLPAGVWGSTPAAELLAAMPFAGKVGIRLAVATPAEVTGRLEWAPDLCTAGGVIHGGALMALADTLGGACAFLNLPPGAGTATISSSTSMLRAVRAGTVTGTARPLNVGRTVVVVQTDLRDGDGRLVAQTTQAQAVLAARPGAAPA
jgi:tryptophan synthase beta chain